MDRNQGLTDEQDVARYLRRDVKKHKSLPYEIKRDEVVGRHMVATRDIKPGEVIFEERPLVFGPSDNTKPICLGCYALVSAETPACTAGCGYPMCSPQCSDIPQHRDNECRLFAQNNFKPNIKKFNQVDEGCKDYAIVMPVRTLMMKRRGDPEWDLVWMHMSHQDARDKSPYWTSVTNKIVEKLKVAISLSDPEEIDLVRAILGIHLVNDFEITPYRQSNCELGYETTEGVQSIGALFALASMPSHSCVANATHDFTKRQDGFKMVMRSVVKIPKGADITHSYTEPLDSILTRKALLRMGKFFGCNCERCSDPTELGTYTSALICSKCQPDPDNVKSGRILPSDVSSGDSSWKCESCEHTVNAGAVAQTFARIKAESERLDADPKVETMENFVSKYSGKVLHPNHVLVLDRVYNLAKMYGRMEGYGADVLTDEQLGTKRALCERALAVLNKIIPGRMRKRAMMMYELHVPCVMLANRCLQRGPSCGVGPDKIKADLKAGLFNLRMSLEILKDEPEESFEWKIVQGSQESVKQLEDWVNTVCSSI